MTPETTEDGTYRITLDNPGANSRTHAEIEADTKAAARRKAQREYPRHIVQKVRSQ
jgi:hypothetical protein